MKKRLLVMLVILLFMGSSFTISNEAGEGRIKNDKVIAKITYKSNECFITTLQPIVIITSPEDGSVVTDPHLTVLGYAMDEIGMNYWEWEWHWQGGSYSNSSYFETAEYVEFRIDMYGLHPGWNLVIVRFKNIYGAWGEDSVNVTYNPSNNPPNKPSKPEGPTEGKVKETLFYSTVTTDPDGDSLEYLIDWGDGTNTGWLGPIASGYPFQSFHAWDEPGIYEVKAKARDLPYLEESEWSDALIVTISGNDTEPPVVVKKYPENGSVFTEPNITAWGYVTDNVGVVSFGYTHEWEGGGTGSSWPLEDEPQNYSFEIPLTLHEGWNRIKVYATDEAGNYGYDEETVYYTLNRAPNTPQKPSGEQKIGPSKEDYDKEYEYTTKTTDPDGDEIRYGWDWNGDGTIEWTDFYASGEECKIKHKWAMPKDCTLHKVRVIAEDKKGLKSGWSEILNVTTHVDSDGDGWCNCEERDKYYTDPNKADTDGDGVKDPQDMDPICNLKLTVEIKRIKALDDVEGRWGLDGADFGANVRIHRFVREKRFEEGDDVTPNWKVTVNIPDNMENIPIRIKVREWDIGPKRCDISNIGIGGRPSGKNLDITFNVRNNEWSGEDYKGDPDGYGHASGENDGEYEDWDAEIWFRIYLNDCDGDGLSYWEEINKYHTDPTKTNNRYAIIIGMADYPPTMEAQGWPDLDDPDNDAQDMYDLLVDECRYDPDNVWYFASGFDDGKLPNPSDLDRGPDGTRNPTVRNVEHALDDIARRATDRDIVVFYYAGHGGGTNGTAPANGGGRIDNDGDEPPDPGLPQATDESLVLYDREYFDDELHARLRHIDHHRLIVILDCCHSGGFIDDLDNLDKIIVTTAVNSYETAHGGYNRGVGYTNGQFTGRFLENINHGRNSIENAYKGIPAFINVGDGQHKQILDKADGETYF